MKNSIIFFLIILITFSFCSCNNDETSENEKPDNISVQSDTSTIKNTINSSGYASTSSTKKQFNEEDIRIIKSFYNDLNRFYENLKKYRYTSLKAEIMAISNSFTEFDNRAAAQNSGDDECAEYYSKVTNNPFYGAIKKWVDNPNQEIDIDIKEIQSTWAYILSEYVEPVLKIELPFE